MRRRLSLHLSTLPLYDHELNTPASFEAIQQFVRERRGEINVYGSSSSDLKKYYAYLADHDIHIDEWRNMRRINGEEGGIKGYFQKNDAFTNHNLFERLIIPEIGSSLGEVCARMKARFSGCSWIPLRLHSGCRCWSSGSGLCRVHLSCGSSV